MNEIAQRLRNLAAHLEKNAKDLDNAAYVKKAVTFNKSLTTFEKATAEAMSGLAPGIHDLERILASPDKKVLKEPEAKKIYQEVLGSKAPADLKAGPLLKLFVKTVKEKGLGEEALNAVKSTVAKARAAATPAPKDNASLKDELLRLGRLDEESFAGEMDSRYKKDPALSKLAKANSIKPPKNEDRAWLIREIRKAAERAASHQIT